MTTFASQSRVACEAVLAAKTSQVELLIQENAELTLANRVLRDQLAVLESSNVALEQKILKLQKRIDESIVYSSKIVWD